MGTFLIIVGFLAFWVGIVMLVTALFRKKPKKKPVLIIVSAFALFVIGAIIAPTVEETAEENTKSTEETKVKEDTKTPEEKKAEEEAKAKEEADKKVADDAEKKAKAEKKLAAEKDYYLAEVKPKIEAQMGMYDEAWSTIWVPTFEGIADGSVDVYKAYENMKNLEQRYETLQSSFPAIPDEGLSKANKKELTEFKNSMRTASKWREEAASKAKDMFNDGDFSPATLDDVKTDVGYSDNEILTAAISLTTLESKLGIVVEE
ncbi:hypothetical protein [Psychrobacillus psychrotolerans]|uniref:hypothetical protein n=1 Tax=Psychrobacillus psychrotolerans TaxID=126156 RepID=UPI003B024D6F